MRAYELKVEKALSGLTVEQVLRRGAALVQDPGKAGEISTGRPIVRRRPCKQQLAGAFRSDVTGAVA